MKNYYTSENKVTPYYLNTVTGEWGYITDMVNDRKETAVIYESFSGEKHCYTLESGYLSPVFTDYFQMRKHLFEMGFHF